MGRLLLSSTALLLILVLAGCENPSGPAVPSEPSLGSIIGCASGALTGPLMGSPNALQHAAAVFEAVDDGTDVLTALETVFGRPIAEFDDDQIDEALFILAGLQDCGEISPILRDSVIGAIGLLRTIPGGALPDDRPAGRALCPQSSPFAPPDQQRFEPNCGPSIEGEWVLERTATACTNFPDGCSGTPIAIRIAECTDHACTVSRTDDVWTASHTLARTNGGLTAEFEDIGIACQDSRNPAELTLMLSVTTSDGDRATGLVGTYEVFAATNPPDCTPNAYAAYDVTARR
jgi:hypothetical protein